VGSLVSVGSGRQAPEWIAEVLLAKDRTQAGMTAPPGGLYFVSADYPSHFGLPDAVDVPVLSQPFSFN
jgi:tRNA pseudouridine38-40 synthase